MLVAIQQELERRRGQLDASDETSQVKITVKFTTGQAHVRAVVWEEERLARRTYAGQ